MVFLSENESCDEGFAKFWEKEKGREEDRSGGGAVRLWRGLKGLMVLKMFKAKH